MKTTVMTAIMLASAAAFAADISKSQNCDVEQKSGATCKECVQTKKCQKDAEKKKCQKTAKKKYIGKKAAVSVALSHAKLERNAVKDLDCVIDSENGVMVYEVEFESAGYDYEYDIDAITGKIIKSKKELD